MGWIGPVGGGYQGQRHAVTAGHGRLVARQMILDNSTNQIAWRGALLSGKYLELMEDLIGKFHSSPHNCHCSMSGLPMFIPG